MIVTLYKSCGSFVFSVRAKECNGECNRVVHGSFVTSISVVLRPENGASGGRNVGLLSVFEAGQSQYATGMNEVGKYP